MNPYEVRTDGAAGPPRHGPERVARLAGRARETFQQGANWLHTGNRPELRAEVEARIRMRPLLSVAVALVAGFAVGRALRD